MIQNSVNALVALTLFSTLFLQAETNSSVVIKSAQLKLRHKNILATVTRHWNDQRSLAHIQLQLEADKKVIPISGAFSQSLIPSSFSSGDNFDIKALTFEDGEAAGFSLFHQIERWQGIRYILVPQFKNKELKNFSFLTCEDYSQDTLKKTAQTIDLWCKSYRHGEFGADAQSILSRIRIEKQNKTSKQLYSLKKISIGSNEADWPDEGKDEYPSRSFPALFVAACREKNPTLMKDIIQKYFKPQNDYGLKRVPETLEKATNFVQRLKEGRPVNCDPL